MVTNGNPDGPEPLRVRLNWRMQETMSIETGMLATTKNLIIGSTGALSPHKPLAE